MPQFAGRFERTAEPLAFAAALLWALHPLVTETVVYTTQRTELMVSFFYLATLYASLRYWGSQAFRWLLAAVVACWAGMASKEVMASAPLLVLLFDRTFNQRTIGVAWRKSRPLYVGLFASWLLLVCLAGSGPRSASAGFHLDVSTTDWWLTQAKVLLWYLRLAVWPWPLSIHYDPPYLTSIGAAWMYVLPVALLVTLVLLLLWRRSAAGYLGTFALAILAPTLLVPIVTEIAAERRMYLPLAALVTLLVVGGYAALRRALPERTALAAITIAAMLLALVGGVVSRHRLDAYADELTLWQDVLGHDPRDATAQYNVGTILLEQNEPQQAAEYFRRAIALRDNYPQAHHNLGAALEALGRHDEATRQFERAVELEPRYAMGHVKLGITAMNAGRIVEAKQEFKQALQWQPNDADAHRALARLLLNEGELDDAIRHARAAIAADPNDAESENTLGAALAQQGHFEDAVPHFEAAVRLDPKMLQALGNLMAAYASLGRKDEAIATAEKALALAQTSGDKNLEEQILTFLKSYRSEPPSTPSSDSREE